MEAQLADLGASDAAGSLRDDDLRAARIPEWRAKVFRAFSRPPCRFDICGHNGPEGMAPVGGPATAAARASRWRWPTSPT